MLDLLIRGGTVIDGTGAPGFSADVAVEGGVIAAVEPLPPDTPARRVIHAAGKLVTPGFIDIHRHADAAAFRPGFGELELRQGLTTIVNGNCGLSAAPFGPAHREEILAYLPYHGDFVSPEQMIPPNGIQDVNGNDIAWESCVTMNNHWGYCEIGRASCRERV